MLRACLAARPWREVGYLEALLFWIDSEKNFVIDYSTLKAGG
jgi:hypothetical protein